MVALALVAALVSVSFPFTPWVWAFAWNVCTFLANKWSACFQVVMVAASGTTAHIFDMAKLCITADGVSMLALECVNSMTASAFASIWAVGTYHKLGGQSTGTPVSTV